MYRNKPHLPITIIYLIPRLEYGGAEQQLYELISGLDRKLFRPLLIYFERDGQKEDEFRNLPGLTMHCLRKKGRFDFFTFFPNMVRLIKGYRVQVIQMYLASSKWAGIIAAGISRIPVTINTERNTSIQYGSRLGRMFYGSIEPTLMRHATVTIANSKAGLAFAHQSYRIPRQKLRMIYNGLNFARVKIDVNKVDAARKSIQSSSKDSIIGVISRLEPNKDHATFLRAARIVLRHFTRTYFLIVGDGSERFRLQTMAGQLGIGDRVQFTGFHTDIAPYLAILSIFVQPSRDIEGIPNSLMEAMGMAKPVVATGVGGTGELVHNSKTGILVPPGQPELMAKAIIRLLENPKWAKKLGDSGQQFIMKHFSLKKMIDSYQDLYMEILYHQRPLCLRD